MQENVTEVVLKYGEREFPALISPQITHYEVKGFFRKNNLRQLALSELLAARTQLDGDFWLMNRDGESLRGRDYRITNPRTGAYEPANFGSAPYTERFEFSGNGKRLSKAFFIVLRKLEGPINTPVIYSRNDSDGFFDRFRDDATTTNSGTFRARAIGEVLPESLDEGKQSKLTSTLKRLFR